MPKRWKILFPSKRVYYKLHRHWRLVSYEYMQCIMLCVILMN